MGMLRKDQLHGFSSGKETPLSVTQLLDLLSRQSKLQSLQVRLDASSPQKESWIAEHAPVFTSALASVRHLRIYVGDRYSHHEVDQDLQPVQRFEAACNQLLLESAPLLDSLEICAWRPGSRRKRSGESGDEDLVLLRTLFRYSLTEIQPPRTLKRLVLADLDLSIGFHDLMRTADLTTLTSLRLEYCDNTGTFLSGYAVSFREKTSQLKTLTIRTIRDKRRQHADYWNIRSELKELLCSFSGLEELELDTDGCETFHWEDSLATHQGLKKLVLSSSDMFARSNPTQIRAILAQCPSIEYYGFRVPILLGGSIPVDGTLPNSLDNRVYVHLNYIALISTLRTLHVEFAPGLRDDVANRDDPAWLERVAERAQRGATLVFRHLQSKGSKIEFLILGPNSRWEQRRPDKNLHYYPFYFYKLQVSDVGGKKVIEAEPVRNYQVEHPESVPFR